MDKKKKPAPVDFSQFPGFSRVVYKPPGNATAIATLSTKLGQKRKQPHDDVSTIALPGAQPASTIALPGQQLPNNQVVKACPATTTRSVHSVNAQRVFSFKSGGGTCRNCDACQAFANTKYNTVNNPINNPKNSERRSAEGAAKRAAYEKSTLGCTVDLSGTTLTLTPRLCPQY